MDLSGPAHWPQGSSMVNRHRKKKLMEVAYSPDDVVESREAFKGKVMQGMPAVQLRKAANHPADQRMIEWIAEERRRADERAESKWRKKFAAWRREAIRSGTSAETRSAMELDLGDGEGKTITLRPGQQPLAANGLASNGNTARLSTSGGRSNLPSTEQGGCDATQYSPVAAKDDPEAAPEDLFRTALELSKVERDRDVWRERSKQLEEKLRHAELERNALKDRLAAFVNKASDTDLAHRVKEGDLEASLIKAEKDLQKAEESLRQREEEKASLAAKLRQLSKEQLAQEKEHAKQREHLQQQVQMLGELIKSSERRTSTAPSEREVDSEAEAATALADHGMRHGADPEAEYEDEYEEDSEADAHEDAPAADDSEAMPKAGQRSAEERVVLLQPPDGQEQANDKELGAPGTQQDDDTQSQAAPPQERKLEEDTATEVQLLAAKLEDADAQNASAQVPDATETRGQEEQAAVLDAWQCCVLLLEKRESLRLTAVRRLAHASANGRLEECMAQLDRMHHHAAAPVSSETTSGGAVAGENAAEEAIDEEPRPSLREEAAQRLSAAAESGRLEEFLGHLFQRTSLEAERVEELLHIDPATGSKVDEELGPEETDATESESARHEEAQPKEECPSEPPETEDEAGGRNVLEVLARCLAGGAQSGALRLALQATRPAANNGDFTVLNAARLQIARTLLQAAQAGELSEAFARTASTPQGAEPGAVGKEPQVTQQVHERFGTASGLDAARQDIARTLLEAAQSGDLSMALTCAARHPQGRNLRDLEVARWMLLRTVAQAASDGRLSQAFQLTAADLVR